MINIKKAKRLLEKAERKQSEITELLVKAEMELNQQQSRNAENLRAITMMEAKVNAGI